MGSCHRFIYKGDRKAAGRAVASQASEVYQSRNQNKGTCGCVVTGCAKDSDGIDEKVF